MLPYSLEHLSDALPGIEAPTGPFDPEGEWEHNYTMWNPSRGKGFKSAVAGSLHIRKRLTTDGDTRLQVTQVIKMQGVNGTGNTKASITCAIDDLTTPIRWEIESEVIDPTGKQVKLTAISVSGEASGGTIILHGEKDRRIKVAGKLSSNWTLMEAVQRLPFDAKELRFDMIEELELLRPEQILWPGEIAEVKLGGRKMTLHSFEQIGTGILPMTYWLDDNHRLIVAVNERRAYLLDSGSPK